MTSEMPGQANTPNNLVGTSKKKEALRACLFKRIVIILRIPNALNQPHLECCLIKAKSAFSRGLEF